MSDKKVLLGLLGERIVAKVLRDSGYSVEESLNVFDPNKDMLVNGKKVEVKCQVPYLIQDAFGVSPSQLRKLLSCRYVFWVSVPPKTIDDSKSGWVYAMDTSIDVKYHYANTKSGRELVYFPRTQPAMKVIYKIDDMNLLNHLKELSSSYL
jgi:hypothetical protein